MPTPIALVDAFTDTPGAGNRAGVVLGATGLDDERRVAISRATGASETVFVEDPAAAELTFRFFTPKEEINFCGHATIAAVSRLVELGLCAAPATMRVKTQRSVLYLETERLPDGSLRVWLESPLAPMTPAPLSLDLLADLLRARPETFSTRHRPFTTAGQMFMGMETRRDLFQLAPRWDALIEAGGAHGIRGFYVYTLDVLDRANAWHGRYFAPSVGVREDPVTGSAIGPLAFHLAERGIIKLPLKRGAIRTRIEQGDAMGRPGRADVEILGEKDAVERVRIGGHAVTTFVGDIHA